MDTSTAFRRAESGSAIELSETRPSIAAALPPPLLPAGWTEHSHPETGEPFFQHETGESTYIRPLANPPPGPSAPQPAAQPQSRTSLFVAHDEVTQPAPHRESSPQSAPKWEEEEHDVVAACGKRIAKTRVKRYLEYERQLKFTPPSDETIRSIQTIHSIQKLYIHRRWAEDIMGILAIVGVMLMVATNEITENERLAWVKDDKCTEKDNKCEVPDTAVTTTLKAFTSLATLLLLFAITIRYMIQTNLKNMRGFYSRRTAVCFCQRYPELWRWLLEMVVCAYHIPPWVDFVVTSPSIKQNTDAYYLHINTFGIFMFVRVYLVARFLRNWNGTYSQRKHFLGSLNGVQVADPWVALKYLFHTQPWNTVAFFVVINTIVTSISLAIIERPSASGVNSYADAVWLTLITMSTVGYGDISPETMVGRIVIIIGGVLGGALLMTMLTGVFVSNIELTNREEHVTTLFSRKAWSRRMRRAAAVMLQRGYRVKLARVAHNAAPPSSLNQLKSGVLENKLYAAQNHMRNLRRKEPPTLGSAEELDVIASKVDKNMRENERIASKVDVILSVLVSLSHQQGNAEAGALAKAALDADPAVVAGGERSGAGGGGGGVYERRASFGNAALEFGGGV